MKKYLLSFVIAIIGNISYCQLDWVVTTGPSTFFSSNVNISNMVVDDFGNTYSCGNFYSTIDFDPGPLVNNQTAMNNWDIFVRKLNVNGELEWIATMGGPGEDKAFGISIDVNQNLLVTGWFRDSADFDPGAATSYLYATPFTWNGFALKLDNNGNYLWSKSFESSLNSRAKTSTSNQNSEYFIVGEFSGDVDMNPGTAQNISSGSDGGIFVTKLDANGNFIWGSAFTGSGWYESYDVKIASDESCIITGHFEDVMDFNPGTGVLNIAPTNLRDIFILSLNSLGQLNWVNTYGGMGREMPSKIATTVDDKIYLTGSFSSSVNFNPNGSPAIISSTGNSYNSFILKLTNSGSFEWVKSVEGYLNNSKEIIVDANGDVIIGGDFWLNADLNPSGGSSIVQCSGDYEIYLLSLDFSGNFLWAKNFPCTNQAYLTGMGEDLAGNLFLSGSYYDTIDFDPGPDYFEMIAVAQPYSFNLKLNSTLSLEETNAASNFKIFPNPTSGKLEITSTIIEAELIEIFSLSGKKIYTFRGTNNLDLAELPSGTYIIVCNNDQREIFIKE